MMWKRYEVTYKVVAYCTKTIDARDEDELDMYIRDVGEALNVDDIDRIGEYEIDDVEEA